MTKVSGRLKPVFGLGVSALCLWALSQQLASVTWESLYAALAGIAFWQWVLALVATGLSFLAIGEYDYIWHRHFQTGVSKFRARVTGMSSIAIAQTVGLGSVTGTFLRWHLLDPLPFRNTAAITIAVCLSFLACWGVLALVTAVAIGLVPIVVCALGAVTLLTAIRVSAKKVDVSNYLAMVPKVLSLTLLDLVFAALALWVLLPDPAIVPFAALFAAFTLALGAGLISNAPGGLGAFELVLLTVLTTTPEADLIAAVLAFRVVYYLVPAVLGGAVLLKSQFYGAKKGRTTSSAPNSDLVWQGAFLQRTALGSCVMRRHILGSVALEPSGWDFNSTPQTIGFQGLYKCNRVVSAMARRNGWVVRRIASDAVLFPQSWTTDGSRRSQLRRKLRQAEKGGIRVMRTVATAPTAEMDHVARAWKAAQGGELGYAMGRYTPDYVARQQTYLIYAHDALVGFVTVQTRQRAWAVDLIRHLPDAPQGAMYAAITKIMGDAKIAGVEELSLGAVPEGPDDNRLQSLCKAKKAGLKQFKATFGPTWRPQYHAAPDRLQFALSLGLVALHIQRPWARWRGWIRKTQTHLINMRKIIHLPHV